MIQRLRQMRNQEGFTLIELLIVIIVLGILAAIVVFAVGGTRGDAVASRCKTDVKSIELSAEAVYAKMGSYPGVTNSSNDSNANLLSGGTNGALLKEWPSDSDYILQWDGDSVEVFNKSKHPGISSASVVDVWNEAGFTTAATPVSCTSGL
jgi:general secretion pathway protein G